jgi:1,4-alpha-glucan branching enzyme
MLIAQVLDVSPAFPTVNDVVTITYDATQGNGTLVGQSQIYAHAGLITSASTSPSNWQYVQGTWGTVDPEVAMTNIGNNKHTITIDIDQFYGYPVSSTTVLKLAFVFRNASGNIVGRNADGSDIFYDVYPVNAGLLGQFFHPNNGSIFNLNDQIDIAAEANTPSVLNLKLDGNILSTLSNATTLDYTLNASNPGTHLLEFEVNDGANTVIDSIYFTVNPTVNIINPSVTGLVNGVNYINDTTVILQLYAPQKEHIYVIGDFNNWTPTASYHMNLSTNNATWWIELSGLSAGQKYGYQYFIDGEMKLADPLSSIILDPNNDGNINALTNPNPHPYPIGQTTGFVSVFQPGATPYSWQNTTFQGPAKKDLVIYELLVRDFVAKHNYQTLIDTLDYLDKLGINAIELMPPGEFENNESWGYNPSFHKALDKYYGTPEKFKEFIDSCHNRGIAVIVDMVLNHAFGQNPMVNMYWDAVNNRPAANNPWFNEVDKHPFGVGYDYNHENQVTKDFTDRVLKYWLTEYKVDGYRFDLSKGFTQKNTLGNVSGWSAYDQSRIDIWSRIRGEIVKYAPNAYLILEHLGDNSEEKVLANMGFMLWGKMTEAYAEATMGYNNSKANLSWGDYKNRQFNFPNLITYAESHDEERVAYSVLQFGNSSGGYNTKDLNTLLKRIETYHALLIPQKGPKMLWMGGELGYEVSINTNGRTGNKPFNWTYLSNVNRMSVYNTVAKLAKLKQHVAFGSDNYVYDVGGTGKFLKVNHDSMNALIVGNFDVVSLNLKPGFQRTGWWYNYITQDSINVTSLDMNIPLTPGSFVVYTDKNLNKTTKTDSSISVEKVKRENEILSIFPNPANKKVNVMVNVKNANALQLAIYDVFGKKVYDFENKSNYIYGLQSIELDLSILNQGLYFVELKSAESKQLVKLILE